MAPDVFRVVTIGADGTATAVQWDTTGGTLALLQDAVGGFVDVVPLHPTIDMWVNDTGLVDALPINWVATTARAFGGRVHSAVRHAPSAARSGVSGVWWLYGSFYSETLERWRLRRNYVTN